MRSSVRFFCLFPNSLRVGYISPREFVQLLKPALNFAFNATDFGTVSCMISHRLQTVSLFHQNLWGRTACMEHEHGPLVGRRAKRDTVHSLVFMQRFGCRHCGDGVILVVGLQSYDAHLSVTFIP